MPYVRTPQRDGLFQHDDGHVVVGESRRVVGVGDLAVDSAALDRESLVLKFQLREMFAFFKKKHKTSHSLNSNLHFLHYILFRKKMLGFLKRTFYIKYPGLTKR